MIFFTPYYIKRSIEIVLKKTIKEFPAVILTGPRQSGKTTLLKHLFGKRYRYISLEPPDIRLAASKDPRGFIEMYSPPVIFDEIQYVPDLFPYIKERIDENREKTGQYLLTGSQNILLMEKVSETLAGRVAVLRLLPFSKREINAVPDDLLPWEEGHRFRPVKKYSYKKLLSSILRGFYPEIAINTKRDMYIWHNSYLQTYIERDVRSMRQIGDLTQFQIFLKTLALRSAQLFNLSDISRDLGIVVNTAKAWLSILEATNQVIILRPYFANIGKRLIKTPKVYFLDTGTLCYLTGVKNIEHIAFGPMGGAIMETAVITEIIKTLYHRGIEPRVYFWRTIAGTEVDLLLEVNEKLIPIEVKLSATPHHRMASSIKIFQKDLKKK